MISLHGTSGFFHKEPWSNELRVPRERCSVEASGAELTVYDGATAIQAIGGCRPRDALRELAAALPRQEAANTASNSGVPIQRVKTYGSAKEMERDSQTMIAQGWRVAGQAAVAGHVNVRRTTARVLTGGLLLGGASRSKDQITVTWEK